MTFRMEKRSRKLCENVSFCHPGPSPASHVMVGHFGMLGPLAGSVNSGCRNSRKGQGTQGCTPEVCTWFVCASLPVAWACHPVPGVDVKISPEVSLLSCCIDLYANAKLHQSGGGGAPNKFAVSLFFRTPPPLGGVRPEKKYRTPMCKNSNPTEWTLNYAEYP